MMGNPTTVMKSTLSYALTRAKEGFTSHVHSKKSILSSQDLIIRKEDYNRGGSIIRYHDFPGPAPPTKCIYPINDSGRCKKKQLLVLLFFVRIEPRYKKRNLEDSEESLKQGSLC